MENEIRTPEESHCSLPLASHKGAPMYTYSHIQKDPCVDGNMEDEVQRADGTQLQL